MENFNCDTCIRAVKNKVVCEEKQMLHDAHKVKGSSFYQNEYTNGFASKCSGNNSLVNECQMIMPNHSENGVFSSACFSNCRENNIIMQGTSHSENSTHNCISFPNHRENDCQVIGCSSDITKNNVSAIACTPDMVQMHEKKGNQAEMDNKMDTRVKSPNVQSPSTVLRNNGAPITGNVKVKLFGCNECSKSYSRKDHLNRHKLIHKGDRPHVCSTCFKSFVRRDKLTRHEKIHLKKDHPELVKNFDCPTCGKVFIKKESYKRHYSNAHYENNS